MEFSQMVLEAWAGFSPHPDLATVERVGRSHRGMDAVLERIASPKVVVEIGGELGGSTRYFLERFPDARVVTIDPWPRGYKISERWRHLERFAPNGYFDLFRQFTYEWRERLLPLRMHSGPGLVELFRKRIVPDMIYLDGDHTFHAVMADLVLCANLFPRAVITGDDWMFDPGLQHTRYMGHVFPVQTAVRQFCHVWGFAVESHENSYYILPK